MSDSQGESGITGLAARVLARLQADRLARAQAGSLSQGSGAGNLVPTPPLVPLVPSGPTTLRPEKVNKIKVVPLVPLVPRKKTTSEKKPLVPDLDRWHERAGILEHDAGLSREAAERAAAKDQGFASPAALFAATVAGWGAGLDRLATVTRDRAGQAHITSARRFLATWGPAAVALGWDARSLFALDPAAPWARLDQMGAAFLHGTHCDPASALTAACITFGRPPRARRFWRAKAPTRLPGWEAPGAPRR